MVNLSAPHAARDKKYSPVAQIAGRIPSCVAGARQFQAIRRARARAVEPKLRILEVIPPPETQSAVSIAEETAR